MSADSPFPPPQPPRRSAVLRGLDPLRVLEGMLAEEDSVAAAPVVPGFALRSELGRGGMARVWLAVRESDGAEVALKVAAPRDDSAAALEDAAARFAEEAVLLARLEHPGIVRVLGTTATAEGRPVLVLEYLAGGNLAARLPAEGFAQGEAVRIFRAVAQAVAFAHSGKAEGRKLKAESGEAESIPHSALRTPHSSAVIHRDLKPANILFTAEGEPKVADFGLARPLSEQVLAFSLTQSGAVAGTVEYLAPECYLAGAEPSAAADQYALGVLLYELLVGTPPRGRWPSASEVRRVDVRLDEVIARALAPEAARRFPSVKAMLDAVDDIAARAPRLSARQRETTALRVSDAAWTVFGLVFAEFCVATGAVATKAHPDLPLALFDRNFPANLGMHEAVNLMLPALGLLVGYQVARLWRMRGLPLAERLPAPFGVRLRAGSRLALTWVLLAQMLVLWIPAAISMEFARRGRIDQSFLIVGYLEAEDKPADRRPYQQVDRWQFLRPKDKNVLSFFIVSGIHDEGTTNFREYKRLGYFPGWEPWARAILGWLVTGGLAVTAGAYGWAVLRWLRTRRR